jgi:hypothetical protein
MKSDQQYVVIKAIPLGGDKSIPVNTDIHRIHGVYYMNGLILSKDYQEDFDSLIEREERTGWNYISPIRQKTMFKNEKEDF